MKFTLAAFLSVALAGQSFNLITTHSGSTKTHLQTWGVDEFDNILLGKGETVKLVLNSDGQLVDTNSGKYLIGDHEVGDGRLVIKASKEKGTKGQWSINDNYLSFKTEEHPDYSLIACTAPAAGNAMQVIYGKVFSTCEGFGAHLSDLKDVEDATV
ncbi:hypothetical protein DICA3_E16710 [Diutina catenulata]